MIRIMMEVTLWTRPFGRKICRSLGECVDVKHNYILEYQRLNFEGCFSIANIVGTVLTVLAAIDVIIAVGCVNSSYL